MDQEQHRSNLWKHWQTIAVAVLSVIASFVIWYLGETGKSLEVQLVSKTSLQAVEKDSVPGLSMSLNGQSVALPYLSVMVIANDGRRPIVSTDYEAPIEIRANPEAKVVSVRNVATESRNLQATVESNAELIRINPLLINPGEKVVVSIFTTGGKPTFTIKARIAGVAPLEIVDSTSKKRSLSEAWGYLIAAVVMMISSLAANKALDAWLKKEASVMFRTRAAIWVLVSSYVCALYFVSIALEKLQEKTFSAFFGGILVIALIGAMAARRLNRVGLEKAPVNSANAAENKRATKPLAVASSNNSSPSLLNAFPVPDVLKTPGSVREYVREEETKQPVLEMNPEKIRARLYGYQVEWDLVIDNVQAVENNKAVVSARVANEFAWAETCPMDLDANPDLRVLRKGSRIKLFGTIVGLEGAPSRILLDHCRVQVL